MPLLLQTSISSAIEQNNSIINHGKIEAKDLKNKAHNPDYYIGETSFSINKFTPLNNIHKININGINTFYKVNNFSYTTPSYDRNSFENILSVIKNKNNHENKNYVSPYLSESLTIHSDKISDKSLSLMFLTIFCALVYSVLSFYLLFKESLQISILSWNKQNLFKLKNLIITFFRSLKQILMLILANPDKHYCSKFFPKTLNLQNI